MKSAPLAFAALTLATSVTLLTACDRAAPAPASSRTSHADQLPAPQVAATRDDYIDTLRPGQIISINNPYGDVHAQFGGFENQIETHAVLQEPAKAAHIQLVPATTPDGIYTIAPRLPPGATVRDTQRLDLSVMVPEGHALHVQTEHGVIDVHGIHGDVDLKSAAGDITLRAIHGAIQAETTEGSIEASLGTAPHGSRQRLATTTGDIQVGVDDGLDATIAMATSGLFATDYSLAVTRHPGEEPNKSARAVVGSNASEIRLDSKRGEIRLMRRAGFTSVGEASRGAATKEQGEDDNDSD
jgi:hypothetical protein